MIFTRKPTTQARIVGYPPQGARDANELYHPDVVDLKVEGPDLRGFNAAGRCVLIMPRNEVSLAIIEARESK